MLIAARESFAAAARKRLPYDAEVEYLQSSGTQYIDTGCNASGDLFYEIQASATQTSVQRMGAIVLSPSVIRHHCSMPERSDRITAICYGAAVPSVDGVAGPGVHTLRINRSGLVVELWLDGRRFGMLDYSTFDLARNFYLFARNDGGGTVSYGSMRIHSAMFYRGDTQIRDYIPVRVGTTGEMYDRITGTFATRVGTLIVGPDKTA